MLRIQPFEMIVRSADQVAIRCHSNSGDSEFLFDAGQRNGFHQDAFFFVTCDDHASYELERAVSPLLAAAEQGMNVGEKGLLFPTSVHALSEHSPPQYRITFRSDSGELEEIYTVFDSGEKMNKVTGGGRSWTGSINAGGWPKMDAESQIENHLARALLYLDMARNAEYRDDVLKMREKKIDWEMVQAQHERNVQRRKDRASLTQEEFERKYYQNVTPADDNC